MKTDRKKNVLFQVKHIIRNIIYNKFKYNLIQTLNTNKCTTKTGFKLIFHSRKLTNLIELFYLCV